MQTRPSKFWAPLFSPLATRLLKKLDCLSYRLYQSDVARVVSFNMLLCPHLDQPKARLPFHFQADLHRGPSQQEALKVRLIPPLGTQAATQIHQGSSFSFPTFFY